MGSSRIGAILLLSVLCILAHTATFSQFTILYTLYLQEDSLLFFVHVAVSFLPPFIIFLYLVYGIKVSGDITNPLLPFIIIWKDLRPYFTSTTELSGNRVYTFCNTYHSKLCSFLSSICTILIVMPIIAILSPILVVLVLATWSIHTIYTKQTKTYGICLSEVMFMTPCFYMYSAMLFMSSIQTETNLVLHCMLFWLSAILYLSVYVMYCSQKQQLSDLVMLTELLLLFSALYIGLLIDYDGYDMLFIASLVMLILSGIADGCLLKAAPIRDYINFSKKFQSELYSFKGNDPDTFVETDKLYCLIHDIVYHQDAMENENVVLKLQKKGYENVERIKEPHQMESTECYELQCEFMRLNVDAKKHRIHHLLDNNIYVITKKQKVSQFKQFAQVSIHLYWFISIVVAIYPFVWLFYGSFVAEGLIDVYNYRDLFVVLVIVLYGIILVKTSSTLYMHYDKYQLIAKLRQIPYVSDKDQAHELNVMYEKMSFAAELNQFIEVEVVRIVLLYVYGEIDCFDKKDEDEEETETETEFESEEEDEEEFEDFVWDAETLSDELDMENLL